jgi:predicted ATP-grasp superfamily ATP-dependent carboligase
LDKDLPFAVVALSGRALAASAAKAGYRVVVFDIFGDVDTHACAERTHKVPGSITTGFDADELVRLVGQSAPASAGLVYGSGLESRPALLAALGATSRIYGNPADVVRLIKDPGWFFALLRRLDVPHPETSSRRPDDPRGWLVKRIGAAGGAHIRDAAEVDETAAGYYQRRVTGRPVSALFVADGKTAQVLGFSEQWCSAGSPASPFRFGGAAVPASIPAVIMADATAAVKAVSAAAGLVGVNSADMLVHENGFHLLEVNPRPGATVDIFDRWLGVSVFHLHVEAAKGRFPRDLRPAAGAFASAIVYAERDVVVPPALDFPSWAADLPEAATRIHDGAPVCTVLAAEPQLEIAKSVARRRIDEIRAALSRVGWAEMNEQALPASHAGNWS